MSRWVPWWMALALTGAAWAAVGQALVRQPSPPRSARFLLGGVAVPPAEVLCHAPAIGVEQAAFALCQPSTGTTSWLTRLDLPAATASLFELPDGEWYLRAFAVHPRSGAVAFVSGAAVFLLAPDGRLQQLPSPTGGYLLPRGLAFAGDALELVDLGPHGDPQVHTLYGSGRAGPAGDETWVTRVAPAPALAEGGDVRLAHAFHEGGRWTFVWTRAPAGAFDDPRASDGGAVPLASDQAPVQAEVWVQPEGQPARRVGAAQVTGEQLRWFHDVWLDPSPGNVVQVALGLRTTHRLHGDRVEPLPRAPLADPLANPGAERLADPLANPGPEPLVRNHLLVRDGRLVLQLRERSPDDPRRVWAQVEDRWLEVVELGHQTFRVGGGPDPVVRGLSDAAEIHLTPDGQGGLWMLGARGDHAHLDADLRRVDPLTPVERWRRLLDPANPAEVRWGAATVPFVLLGFPVLGAVALVLHRAAPRRPGSEWPQRWFVLALVAGIAVGLLAAPSFLRAVSAM